MIAAALATETEIDAGTHPTFRFIGLTFNSDTMLSTVVAASIVLIFGFLLRSQVNDRVPSKVQLLWEMLVEWVQGLVKDSIGRLNPVIVPLAVSLFLFILIGNWFEVIPTGHHLPPPAADVNVTYSLAFIVIIGVHIFGIREQGGIGTYIKGYFEPFKALFVLNVIEEIVKPFSLALRLFGNIFAGGIILSLIGLMAGYIGWAPTVIWKLFGMAIGGIQAFIFALLTILYFGFAASGHGGGEEEHAPKKDAPEKAPAEQAPAEQAPAEQAPAQKQPQPA